MNQRSKTTHRLDWRPREGHTWIPATEERFKKAAHLAYLGQIQEAIWEAEDVEAAHHRAHCDRKDHGHCRSWHGPQFSVLTKTETRSCLGSDFEEI